MRNLIIVGLLAATGLAACGGPQRVQRRNQFHLSYSDFDHARFVTHPDYLKRLGASYIVEERYDEARDAYMDALLLHYGDDFESQVAIGLLYEREGDTNRAAAHYARARSVRPGHLAGWYHLERVKPRMVIMPSGMQADGWNPTKAAAGGDDDEEDDG